MELEEFEDVVSETLERLPSKFRKILREEEIEILSREKVPVAVRERFPKIIVFGVFVGVSRKNKSTFSIQTEPTRIELYKESFEQVYGQGITDAIKKRIAQTVIHEIAHYFGFNEDEIAARGF